MSQTTSPAKRDIAGENEQLMQELDNLLTELTDEVACKTYNGWARRRGPEVIRAEIIKKFGAALTAEPPPVDMLLDCPACGLRHVDEPSEASGWLNPPHRSHLCLGCGHVWRPADVPTNGVAAIVTHGSMDSPNVAATLTSLSILTWLFEHLEHDGFGYWLQERCVSELPSDELTLPEFITSIATLMAEDQAK